jgi:hypothetical protein
MEDEMKFSLCILAAGLCLSLAACNHDSSSTDASTPAAVDPQGLPTTDGSGAVIPGTTVWSGNGRRACAASDRELIHNVRRDLKAVQADAQVGWAQGQSGRHHSDAAYLIVATTRAERGIQECNRMKAEIQFSSCQVADVNRGYERVSRECDQVWDQHTRLVGLLKKLNVHM